MESRVGAPRTTRMGATEDMDGLEAPANHCTPTAVGGVPGRGEPERLTGLACWPGGRALRCLASCDEADDVVPGGVLKVERDDAWDRVWRGLRMTWVGI